MPRPAAIVAIVLGLAAPVALAADDGAGFLHADTGLEAYRRLDFAAALGAWRPLARRGDARAQTWIGLMHAEGKGVARDHAEAVRWLTRAASQGYAEAEFRLGVIHEFGHGMPEDKPRARHYFRLAADHAHVEAQIRLSVFHELGIGTALDLVSAHMWADIAARIAQTHAQQVIAAGMRTTIAEVMTPEQTAEARRRARAWIKARARDD